MKTRFFSLAAIAIMGLAACGNDGNKENGDNDNTTNGTNGSTSATTTNASTGDYAARADSFQVNSEAGNYLNPATGKSGRINVDRSTGKITWSDNNEPVDYYVDRRTWWVYDNEGNQVSRARMESDRLMFEDKADNWVDYKSSRLWNSDENVSKHEVEKDGDTKTKFGEDQKIKTEKDGDVKIRMGNTKIKKDEDGIRVKEKDNK